MNAEDDKGDDDEGEDYQMTDEGFDEAMLMGDDRKSLKSLSPEEAAEEVR